MLELLRTAYFSGKSSMASNSIAQKFRIREGFTLRTLRAPKEFEEHLGELPPGVTISAKTKNYDQVHWFVRDRAQLEAELSEVLSMIKDNVVCWIYYPKGTSKIQTDLTRDKGWDALLKNEGMQWISLISFDDTWSSFGMRLKTDADRKKESKPRERPIFDYIDPVKKTIRLPEDFAAALNKAPGQKTFFDSLSFSNRKEYLEWIVTAKREETRAQRVQESVERLKKGWKNPANG